MMDRTEESKPTSRRKQILDAAFFLATKSEVWSLADIAAVVGVSKTAIYRHFTNRAEIEEEMTRELIEAVSTAIDTAKESPNAIRLAVVSLLRAKPGYLQYIVQRIITTEGFVPIMIESLISQNERIASFFSRLERLRKGVQSHIRADLLISSVSVIIASFADDRLRLIQDQLLESLARGFPELQAVTESRLAELDKICLLEKRNEEESDRLISAIARTIQAHGLKNTTIENIAQEMGMAKSSLYFYCKNKNEMLASLIK
ncbi:MAG TPA: TetR/AcrR family transcriptional regulator, partial [Treponemataceae bacterium]|nr:TetR/AcrR family transcriptional regulator [Treponemataceae bacterium]